MIDFSQYHYAKYISYFHCLPCVKCLSISHTAFVALLPLELLLQSLLQFPISS